jgi:hypothetical protein
VRRDAASGGALRPPCPAGACLIAVTQGVDVAAAYLSWGVCQVLRWGVVVLGGGSPRCVDARPCLGPRRGDRCGMVYGSILTE